MPRLSSRTSSGVPPWWKTTLRPVSADVATTAAEISRPVVDVRGRSSRTGSGARACACSGVASSSDGTSSDSRPVKVSAARAIRSRSRSEGVASTSPQVISSHSSRPGAQVRVVVGGGQVGAVDGADARADDHVRALVVRQRGQQHRQHSGLVGAARPAAGEHERDRLASSRSASRTVSRNARAVARWRAQLVLRSDRPRTRGGGRPARARSRRSRPRAPRACRPGRRAGTASGRASSCPACRARG